MAGNRLLVHYVFLLALPILVAYFGLTTSGAIAMVLATLAWRLAITLSVLIFPHRVPKLELESIAISHFVEKVRWSMDRLGVEYSERQVAGIIGVLFLGRTVPQLKIRTGRVRSVIGESPAILRYLWGAYSAEFGDKAAFLEPTPDRLKLEKSIDDYGVNLQVWLYHHILPHRAISLQAWGGNAARTPLWQRAALHALFPLLSIFLRRAFAISDDHYREAVERIDSFLQGIEDRVAADQSSILSAEGIDYVDISFAAISAVWLLPDGFAAGKADEVRIAHDAIPPPMRSDIDRWRAAYPNSAGFVERLYAQER